MQERSKAFQARRVSWLSRFSGRKQLEIALVDIEGESAPLINVKSVDAKLVATFLYRVVSDHDLDFDRVLSHRRGHVRVADLLTHYAVFGVEAVHFVSHVDTNHLYCLTC